MKAAALQLLRELTEAHGAPGHEDAVRALFRHHLCDVGSLACDRLGSIQCTLRADHGPRVMVTAHMDEVGFMVQSITEGGFLRVVPLGGWWTHNLLAQRVRVKTRSHGEKLGVVGSTPPHFLSDAEKSKVLAIEHLFVDLGARNRKEVEETMGVRVGDPVVPDTEFTPVSDGDWLLAKAFDNRVGVGVVIQTLQQLRGPHESPNTLLGVATVQEEVGCRGAETAARLAQPDVALVIEGTPADDTPGNPAGSQQGAIGGGPQIRVMDPTALMNTRLVDFVRDVATEKGIPHQTAVRRSGGTDAKSFTTSGLGIPCVVIGVPARYIHSHNSMIHLDDYLATVTLVTEVVKRLGRSEVAELTDFLR